MLTTEQIAAAEANGHSIFGGSTWHRALKCTRSVLASIFLPDTSGVDAAEGTLAHEVAAQMLEYGLLPSDFADSVGRVFKRNRFDITLTDAMLHHVEQYAIWCRDAEVPGCIVLVEHRIDYSHLTPIPKQGGSADHVIMAPRLLILTDLKYGDGVQVFAERNFQLFAYALGLVEEWDFIFGFERIVFRICQPRLDHFDVWETTTDELLDFADYARRQMAEAWSENARYAPSEEVCKFCRAKNDCVAALSLMDRLADDSFEDLTASTSEVNSALARMAGPKYYLIARKPRDLTSLEIDRLLRLQAPVNTVFNALYEELSRRVFLGENVEGWGVVPGRATRALTDPSGVADELDFMGLPRDAVYERKVLSPAKLEETLVAAGLRKKDAVKLLKPYVTSTPGQNSVARLKKGKETIADLDGDIFEDVRENP